MDNQKSKLDSDKEAVLAADNDFYSALNILFTGHSEPMEKVWSHLDDVIYMGPDNAYLQGWKAISDVWRKQAANKLGGKVEPKNKNMMMGLDMAVITNLEIGENVDKDGKPVTVSIRATNIFRKESGQWKMIGHHTDLLPYML